MHGCVTKPEDIILTRGDYIRYAERHAALSGVCQSLLLTKHMLFVGFSLDDDNFHKIFDSVKKSVPTAPEGTCWKKLGTVLQVWWRGATAWCGGGVV